MNKLNIKVILGSTRESRFGEQPANWILDIAKKRDDLDVELLDLKDFALPFYDGAVTPKNPNYVPAGDNGKKWAEKIGEADGYIFVTPEYNHGYSAVLKNAIDYLYREWNRKPVAFVGYGSVGGGRAIEQLRQVVNEVQMHPIQPGVYIVAPWNLLDENGKWKSEGFEDNAKILLDDLTWWATALKNARNS